MNKNNKGFTLIELLVVIAIIGTLSGIVLVSLGGARSRARDSVRQSDMRQLVTAQEMYYSDNEAYLADDGSGTGTPAIGTYLDALDDAQASQGRHYIWVDNTSDAQKFCVYVEAENIGDCTGDTSDTRYFTSSEKGSGRYCGTSGDLPTLGTCYSKDAY